MSAPMFCRSGVAGQLSAAIHSLGVILLDGPATRADPIDASPVEHSAQRLRDFLQHAREQIALRRRQEPGWELSDSAQLAIDDATDYAELLERFSAPCSDAATWRTELTHTAAAMVLRDHAERLAAHYAFPATRRAGRGSQRRPWPLWAQRGGWIGYLIAMFFAQTHFTEALLRAGQLGWTVVLTLFALGTYASWVDVFRGIGKPSTPTKEFEA